MLETILLVGLFTSIFGSILGSYQSQRNVDKQNKEAEKLQEDAQDFTHQERIEQNEYQQQMHEFNLINDPRLSFAGLKGVGISDAAAAQAIAGSPSVGYSPTASNGGSGIASPAAANSFFPGFQGIGDAVNQLIENEKTISETEKNKQDVKYSQQMVDESLKRMDKMANDMHIDNEQLEVAKIIAQSQVDKNASDIRINEKTLGRIDSEIKLNFTKISNLDANTALQYVQASKMLSDIEVNESDIALKNAQAGYYTSSTQLVNEQVTGQQISNLDSSIVAEMKRLRMETSKALGCDVDADETTKVLEAMVLGRYDTVQSLLYAIDATNDNTLGSAFRIGKRMDSRKSFDRLVNPYSREFSNSLQSTWNPQTSSSGHSFRW